MSVIQIIGTSGSGKSTLVRRVMELYPRKFRVKKEGRRQPYGYIMERDRGPQLFILGHYETACGGCDTISSMDAIFEAVKEAHAAEMNVLFEGLLISALAARTLQLHQQGLDLRVVALEVPLEQCLDSINQRRWAKNPDKPPVNPKNTEQKFKGVQTSMRKLQANGVPAVWMSRDDAFEYVREVLHLS